MTKTHTSLTFLHASTVIEVLFVCILLQHWCYSAIKSVGWWKTGSSGTRGWVTGRIAGHWTAASAVGLRGLKSVNFVLMYHVSNTRAHPAAMQTTRLFIQADHVFGKPGNIRRDYDVWCFRVLLRSRPRPLFFSQGWGQFLEDTSLNLTAVGDKSREKIDQMSGSCWGKIFLQPGKTVYCKRHFWSSANV